LEQPRDHLGVGLRRISALDEDLRSHVRIIQPDRGSINCLRPSRSGVPTTDASLRSRRVVGPYSAPIALETSPTRLRRRSTGSPRSGIGGSIRPGGTGAPLCGVLLSAGVLRRAVLRRMLGGWVAVPVGSGGPNPMLSRRSSFFSPAGTYASGEAGA
jgi:hypothetical protein